MSLINALLHDHVATLKSALVAGVNIVVKMSSVELVRLAIPQMEDVSVSRISLEIQICCVCHVSRALQICRIFFCNKIFNSVLCYSYFVTIL